MFHLLRNLSRILFVQAYPVAKSGFRLNPTLKKSCNKDIKKYCNNVISQYNEEEGSLEGQVINCLKESALQKQKLSEKCMKEVVLTMVDAAKLVDADPVLEKLCPTSLVQLNKISILNPMNDKEFLTPLLGIFVVNLAPWKNPYCCRYY